MAGAIADAEVRIAATGEATTVASIANTAAADAASVAAG
jgi:hypothetical protein